MAVAFGLDGRQREQSGYPYRTEVPLQAVNKYREVFSMRFNHRLKRLEAPAVACERWIGMIPCFHIRRGDAYPTVEHKPCERCGRPRDEHREHGASFVAIIRPADTPDLDQDGFITRQRTEA